MDLPTTIVTLLIAFGGSLLTARLVRPVNSADAVNGTIGAFVIAVGVFLYFGWGHFDNAPEAVVYGFATALVAAPFVCFGALGVRRIRERSRVAQDWVRRRHRSF